MSTCICTCHWHLALLLCFNLFEHISKSLRHLGCRICSLPTVGAGTRHHGLSPEDLADLKGSVKKELHDVQEVWVDLHSLQYVCRAADALPAVVFF